MQKISLINYMKERASMRLTKKTAIIASIVFITTGFYTAAYFIQKKIINRNIEISKKLNTYNQLLGQWILNKTDNYDIAAFLEKKGIRKVAIYGHGLLGNILSKDLKNLEVVYFIDNNGDNRWKEIGHIPVFKPEEIAGQEPVDAIIVTAYYYFDEIYNNLRQYDKIEIPVISLEDLIYYDEYAEEK